MSNRSQTIHVIDDDQAVRDSLRWLIESVGLEVETFASAAEFLDKWTADMAGCLVVDIRLPGMSGLDLQDNLKNLGCRLPIVIITGHGDVPAAIRAMKAGAFDFIEKPFSDQVLLDRIRGALRRDLGRRIAEAERSELQRRLDTLTKRERQVLDGVVQGKLNKQIATELDLSPKTIEVHRSHMMQKMGAATLAELIRVAVALEEPVTP